MNQLKDKIGKLLFLFSRGKRAYASYLNDDKKYIYAKILKDNNDQIKQLLLDIAHSLPEDTFEDCIELMHHIDVWSVLWIDLELKKSPQLDDTFVFENKINYPPTVEEKIRSFYCSL